MNCLVIGGTTDGIGATFAKICELGLDNIQLFIPKPSELDVRWSHSPVEWFNYHGPMDQVLYCAGTKHLNWIADLKIEDVRDTFAVNVFGFINVIKAMALHPPARICVITSDAAVTPMSASIDYCSSKAALEMAIKVAAREMPEWHITGIRSSAVSGTEMNKYDLERIAEVRGMRQDAVALRLQDNPLHRMIERDELCDLAYWLLFRSPHAMTGSIVEMRCGK